MAWMSWEPHSVHSKSAPGSSSAEIGPEGLDLRERLRRFGVDFFFRFRAIVDLPSE